jgi:hypothetical protein
MNDAKLYGLIAEFTEPDHLLAAALQAHAEGYRRCDAFTPYHVEGLAEAIGMHRTGVPLVTLICALGGATIGYAMQLYSAAADYPINVGGRPLHSWPAFVPITFELAVLFGAFGTAIGMLLLNGLPRPHHPVFETPFFAERNQSRFYLCIEAADPRFDRMRTEDFLQKQNPAHIWEVPA